MQRFLASILPRIAVLCWLSSGFPASSAAAVSVTDDTGRTVRLTAPARRIVSLAPHLTELIYAAGGGAYLVGAVAYSDFPPQAKTVPRIGDNLSLDLERIVALRPDLIVGWKHGDASPQLDKLRTLQIPLFLSAPRQLDDIAITLNKLGHLMQTTAAADAAAAYRQQITQLRMRYAKRPSIDVFLQIWAQPLMTLNGAHLISQVITLCGGRNVFASLRPLVPMLTEEAVLAAQPEVIVTLHTGTLSELARWRRWPNLTAAVRDNLFAINGDLLSRPTPRLAQGAALLCNDLEQARARR